MRDEIIIEAKRNTRENGSKQSSEDRLYRFIYKGVLRCEYIYGVHDKQAGLLFIEKNKQKQNQQTCDQMSTGNYFCQIKQ